jgi:hypothetical protein
MQLLCPAQFVTAAHITAVHVSMLAQLSIAVVWAALRSSPCQSADKLPKCGLAKHTLVQRLCNYYPCNAGATGTDVDQLGI